MEKWGLESIIGGGETDANGTVGAFSLLLTPSDRIIICTDDCSVDVEGRTQLLDIIFYVGYKFVASTALLLLRILHLRASLYWTVIIYLLAANGFFLVCFFLSHLQNPFWRTMN